MAVVPAWSVWFPTGTIAALASPHDPNHATEDAVVDVVDGVVVHYDYYDCHESIGPAP